MAGATVPPIPLTPGEDPVRTDTLFCVLGRQGDHHHRTHMLVERGTFARLIAFASTAQLHQPRQDRTTIRHVLTHSAGILFATAQTRLRRMDDSVYAREMLGERNRFIGRVWCDDHHGLTWGPLMREIISVATGRSVCDISCATRSLPAAIPVTNYGMRPEDCPLVATAT